MGSEMCIRDRPNALICFLVWPPPDTADGCARHHATASWVPYHLNTITLGDTILPLARSAGSPPRTVDLTRPPAMATAKRKKTKQWLSSPRSDWRDLQRRCQSTPTQPMHNSVGLTLLSPSSNLTGGAIHSEELPQQCLRTRRGVSNNLC